MPNSIVTIYQFHIFFWVILTKLLILLPHLTQTKKILNHLSESPSNLFQNTLSDEHSSHLDNILEVTTFLEADIDVIDKLKLTTRIRDHLTGQTTMVTPSFEKVDGQLQFSQSLLQQKNPHGYELKGAAKARSSGTANLALHVQQFDIHAQQDNQVMYSKYAKYLKQYIDFLYKYNLDLDPGYLRNLEQNFVYYGSLANGKQPSLEASFRVLDRSRDSRETTHETIGGTADTQDSAVSYGVSNINGEGHAQSFQNMFSTGAGVRPTTGLRLKTQKEADFIRTNLVGQAMSEASKNVAMTMVNAKGENGGEGFSDQASFSEQQNGALVTVSEMNGLSLTRSENTNEKELFNQLSEKNFGKKTYHPKLKQKEQIPTNTKRKIKRPAPDLSLTLRGKNTPLKFLKPRKSK